LTPRRPSAPGPRRAFSQVPGIAGDRRRGRGAGCAL